MGRRSNSPDANGRSDPLRVAGRGWRCQVAAGRRDTGPAPHTCGSAAPHARNSSPSARCSLRGKSNAEVSKSAPFPLPFHLYRHPASFYTHR